LPYQRACSHLRDVATSLALLHARGLIHRDLSPSNVRVTEDGHCKLFDFGALASFGPNPRVVGTAPLIAPEAIEGVALDQRTDLYALGALAYWVLTGRHAFSARKVAELPQAWKVAPAPPSAHVPEIPPALDALVLSLLRRDPLARPAHAAEVIARLDVIGQLPPEDGEDAQRLAQSFFIRPHFVGRTEQLDELSALGADARRGQGSCALIDSDPGMGRTRLLQEVAMRLRVEGTTVLWADASAHRHANGTTQTLVLQLLEQLQEPARKHMPRFHAALSELDSTVLARIGALAPSLPPPAAKAARPQPPVTQATQGTQATSETPEAPTELAELFTALSHERPLALVVDNCEDADDASLGLLASIASRAEKHPLLLMIASTPELDQRRGVFGAAALHRHARALTLSGLELPQVRALIQSIFVDTPHQERLAEWLHTRAAGSPLHIVELCRRLLSNQTIRYASGLWTLPVELPSGALPAALNDVLSLRLNGLTPSARALAECLSLRHGEPTLQLCRLLCESESPQGGLDAASLLDELVKTDVLQADEQSYHFSSSALRSALVSGIKRQHGTWERHHRRLGAALEQLAGPDDDALRLEAGFHLIQGDDDLRGARMIAAVTNNPYLIRRLCTTGPRIGPAIEAALKACRRKRLSQYERLPLLAAVAQAGYYEERHFADNYGDEALDVLEQATGLQTARRLRPYLGRALSLVFGVLIGYVCFLLAPRRTRSYAFKDTFVHLFSTLTTLAGTAGLCLDAERADAIADTLEPFSFLPERLTPVGIYQFLRGIAQIPRENAVAAARTFETLLERFKDRSYYVSLPEDGRKLYLAAIHFAHASLALLDVRGQRTLDATAALEATGMRVYAMIASQLRYLYYLGRGQAALAEPHRLQVELHAAHIGSTWQLEAWQATYLTLVQGVCFDDVVGATRALNCLEELSRTIPSLKRYKELAHEALGTVLHRDRRALRDEEIHELATEPRSFLGWAAVLSGMARTHNDAGAFARAHEVAQQALQHIRDEDRDLVALFLPADLEMARSEAGLGDVDGALARLDRLLARYSDCDHPLPHGLLHETRARICWNAKRFDEFRASRKEVERWFRLTGTPALIAKCERLASLETADELPLVTRRVPPPAANDSVAVTIRDETKQPRKATL